MSSPQQPQHYKRRVLLVVIGLTPQIVTEALFKLAVDSAEAFVPTEVHIVTTEEGARSAEVSLLGVEGSQGMFYRFLDDYWFKDTAFPHSNIHIITDTEGQFISDAESGEHNRIAADFITSLIQSMCEDEDSALHISLAGGRKTMSYYAGYALSLFGRYQDRLSHVLVNAPFMNHRDFFYPRPAAERLEVNGKFYSTDDARIILADIPYVRMRYQVPEQLLQGKAGFQETVEKIQRFSEPDTLELNAKNETVLCNGIPVKLGTSEFAFYLWMCERKQRGESPLILEADDFMSDFLAVYARFVNPNGGMYGRAEVVAKEKGVEDQKRYFWTKRSAIHKKIKSELGESVVEAFYIRLTEVEGDERAAYELALPGEQIIFV